ncbi:MAG: response regulator [Pedobacter sp.]|nr:response regulator [Pedobacter sp.]
MQVNPITHATKKYKALVLLHFALLLLYGYLANSYKSGFTPALGSVNEQFRYYIVLCFILFLSILYYLLKIYKQENRLLHSNQQAIAFAQIKRKLLVNMSHEIRTPLNSIIGFSEQLSQSKLDAKQTEQLKAIRSSSTMLLNLVNNILDFSKYETYKVNFDKLPFFPFEAIHDVVNGIAIQAHQKGVELKTEVSFKNTICFSGDSLCLKQVVINLLSNAIKFTESGSVTLKADIVLVANRQVMLNVQIIDTGVGIAAKDLDKIFEEFAQVNYSLSHVKHKGTGLGLAICKRIVEFQSGKIKVISEMGRGSIFSFSIPYPLCDKKLFQSKVLAKIDSSNLTGKYILIVDDNKMNIFLAQTVIANYNMIADIAYDGEEAFELFERNKYDLILTDIQMPKMNGVQLSKAIRSYSDKTKRNIPILGVTASVLSEGCELYANSGMNDVVLKPFSENELIDKIAAQFKQPKL